MERVVRHMLRAIFHKQRKWPTILGHSRGYMDFRYLSKQTNVLFILFSSVSHTHLVCVSHLRTYILVQTCIHTWLFLCDSVRKYSHVRFFFFFLVIFVSYSLYKIIGREINEKEYLIVIGRLDFLSNYILLS